MFCIILDLDWIVDWSRKRREVGESFSRSPLGLEWAESHGDLNQESVTEGKKRM